MRARLCALAATTTVAAAVIPAHGATAPAPKPQIADVVGDANGVNDQGFGSPVQVSVGTAPADVDAADITNVLFQTTFKTVTTIKKVVVVVKGKKVTKLVKVTTKVPTGSVLAFNTTAAPNPDLQYTLSATSSSCKGTLFIEYSESPAGFNDVTCSSGLASADVAAPAPVVKGNAIVWTFPLSALPLKTSLSDLQAETLDPTDSFVIDVAYGSTGYTVGT